MSLNLSLNIFKFWIRPRNKATQLYLYSTRELNAFYTIITFQNFKTEMQWKAWIKCIRGAEIIEHPLESIQDMGETRWRSKIMKSKMLPYVWRTSLCFPKRPADRSTTVPLQSSNLPRLRYFLPLLFCSCEVHAAVGPVMPPAEVRHKRVKITGWTHSCPHRPDQTCHWGATCSLWRDPPPTPFYTALII